MTRNFGVLAPAFMVLAFVGYACTQGEVVEGPAVSGAAGSTNPGTAGTGNTVGAAGTTGVGNTVGTGGSNTSRGGTTGQAGSTSRGGTTGQAGNTSRGGTTGQAGSNPQGTGGSNPAGTGGSSPAGTGGSGTSACGSPSFAVSADGFVQMPVTQSGCWSGYPFTYADTYGTTAMPMSFATCGMPCMLKLTGNIVPVAAPNYSYAGLGFNLGQTPAGGTTNTPVTPKGTGLTFNFANTTTGTGLVLRAQLTNGTTTWCTNITSSPAVVPYSSFTVNCYNTPPGMAYAKEPITQIQLNLAGGTTAGTMNITLNSVTEN
jgi:hypothetical protein